ncbi:MAG: hypothetical protein ACK5JT_03300 [Hyphomicrobiaceae bacterium]
MRRLAAGAAALLVVAAMTTASAAETTTGKSGGQDTEGTSAHIISEARRLAGALAEKLSGALDAFMSEKSEKDVQAQAVRGRDTPAAANGRDPAYESGTDWLTRAGHSYGDVVERLSQPTAPNPVADAVRRFHGNRNRVEPSDVARGGSAGPEGVSGVLEAVKMAEAKFQKEIVGRLEREGGTAGVADPASRAIAVLNDANKAFQTDIVNRLATPPTALSKPSDKAIAQGKGEPEVAVKADAEEGGKVDQSAVTGAVGKTPEAATKPEADQNAKQASAAPPTPGEQVAVVSGDKVDGGKSEPPKSDQPKSDTKVVAGRGQSGTPAAAPGAAVKSDAQTEPAAQTVNAVRAHQDQAAREAAARAKREYAEREAAEAAERARAVAKAKEERERLAAEARRAEIARKAAAAERAALEASRSLDMAKAEARRKSAAAEWRAAEAKRVAATVKAEENNLKQGSANPAADSSEMHDRRVQKAIESRRADEAKAATLAREAEEIAKRAREAARLITEEVHQAQVDAQAAGRSASGHKGDARKRRGGEHDRARPRKVAHHREGHQAQKTRDASGNVAAVVRPAAIRRPGEVSVRHAGGVKPSSAHAVAAGCSSAGENVQVPGWYVVAPGDSLTVIAKAHYGTGRKYRRILRANRSRISDEDSIEPCTRLYLP